MDNTIYLGLRSLRRRYYDHKYHASQNRLAVRFLENIERTRGKTNPALLKIANEYARETLGWIGYSPWLHVYCAVRSCFHEGWIPDNYYGRVIVPIVNGSYGKLSDMKDLSRLIFRSNHFPDIGYVVQGRLFSSDMTPLSPSAAIDSLFSHGDKVIFKLGSSRQGLGVRIFTRSMMNVRDLEILGDGVFQVYIRQHSFFDELMPHSVATLRMTTAIGIDGNPSVRAAYLRIGRADDTHVKAASNLRIPLDAQTGELASQGYLPDWTYVERHPDTGICFDGMKVVHYEKCVATALELHRRMPHARCIGWDLVIDQANEVCVMEWNGNHNDIKFSEATVGPCFKDLKWDQLWNRRGNRGAATDSTEVEVLRGSLSDAARNDSAAAR